MKLVRWSFHNIQMPMMENDTGQLFCTSSALCAALGAQEEALRQVYRRHPNDFEGVCVTDCHAIEFLREHKQEFGMKYVRGDMRLWSEQDMVSFAMLSRSDVSVDFRRQLNEFIRTNARRDYVSKEQYMELEEELAKTIASRDSFEEELAGVKGRLAKLESIFELAVPNFSNMASAAGSVLANHRVLKGVGDN